jgi:hypothetical protein
VHDFNDISWVIEEPTIREDELAVPGSAIFDMQALLPRAGIGGSVR